VRRSSAPNLESFGHRTHDEEVAEFEDEPDTPDESEAEASDAEFSERVPLTPSTPLNPPARNGGFKPRGPSPLALSAAAVPPVPIRDQAQSAALVAIWEAEHRFTAEQEAAMAALRGKMLQAGLLTPFWDYKPAFYRFCQARGFNVDKAWLMLTAHLEWRKQTGLDTFTLTEGGEVPSFIVAFDGYSKSERAKITKAYPLSTTRRATRAYQCTLIG